MPIEVEYIQIQYNTIWRTIILIIFEIRIFSKNFATKQQKCVNMRCYCMVCPSVRKENPRALASELSLVQMTENKSTSSNHENSNNYFCFLFLKKILTLLILNMSSSLRRIFSLRYFLFVPYRSSHWKGL